MKDVSGNEVAVGDTIAYCRPYYKELQVAVIDKINPTTVRVRQHDGFLARFPEQISLIKKA